VKEVALVTYQDYPTLSSSDQRLLQPLADAGMQPIAVLWDNPDVDWQRFAAVVLRSCWDYHKRFNKFKQWIRRLEALDVPLYNPPQTVLWNMEKTYLRELAQHGIRTIPTLWINSDEKCHLRELLKAQDWQQAVVKPTIGASGYGIQVVSMDNAEDHQSTFEELLTSSGVMVQPVVKEIQNGELSLVFYRHQFSHAIRKLPGHGTIFVNSAYGGSYQEVNVPQHMIDTAASVLDTARRLTGDTRYLYARVDGVMVDDTFVLMELELIEPGLFLNIAPLHAAVHFADAIADIAHKGI
jgi:glutathione synthase/RimK-type ligase-like ATP-grasp enzyme